MDSLVRDVQSQVGALQALATANGVQLHHVKPHGALYNAMMVDDALLVALAEGVAAVAPSLVFVLQATPNRERHEQLLAATGLALAFEAFADRRYASDGRLESRDVEGSVLTDPDDVEQHVRSILGGSVETAGGPLPIQADTLCIHGDNARVAEVVERVRTLIPSNG